MILKICDKRVFSHTAVVAIACAIFTAFARFDSVNNDFLYFHDYEVDIEFNTLISVMNVVLFFPFAMLMLVDRKKTNEIYIVPRISNSSKFYFIKFFQLLLLCFVQSLIYNLSLFLIYCILCENRKEILFLLTYTIIADLAVELVFVSVMQLLSVLINEKIALLLTIASFCACTFAGLITAKPWSYLFVTNYYFISFAFSYYQSDFKYILLSLALPLVLISVIVVPASVIYKKKDHI